MEELVSLNPVVAAESVAVIDSGICLLSPLPMPLYGMKGSGGGVHREGLKKLAKIIAAEHEYERVDALLKKREEKHRQIEETSAEAEEIKTELRRLQNASMLERMKQGINKTNVESTHVQLQDKLALVERLKQHASALLKEHSKGKRSSPFR